MKIEKFRVVENIRQFIMVSNIYLKNFPKKEYALSDKIKRNSYDILELAYYANSSTDLDVKIDKINNLLAKVRVIDFLLDYSQDNKYIENKHYLKLCMRIGDIEKFCTGWIEKINKYKENEKMKA